MLIWSTPWGELLSVIRENSLSEDCSLPRLSTVFFCKDMKTFWNTIFADLSVTDRYSVLIITQLRTYCSLKIYSTLFLPSERYIWWFLIEPDNRKINWFNATKCHVNYQEKKTDSQLKHSNTFFSLRKKLSISQYNNKILLHVIYRYLTFLS